MQAADAASCCSKHGSREVLRWHQAWLLLFCVPSPKSHAPALVQLRWQAITKQLLLPSAYLNLSNSPALCIAIDMVSVHQIAAATKHIPVPERWLDTGGRQEGLAQECWPVRQWSGQGQQWWWGPWWLSQELL